MRTELFWVFTQPAVHRLPLLAT